MAKEMVDTQQQEYIMAEQKARAQEETIRKVHQKEANHAMDVRVGEGREEGGGLKRGEGGGRGVEERRGRGEGREQEEGKKKRGRRGRRKKEEREEIDGGHSN